MNEGVPYFPAVWTGFFGEEMSRHSRPAPGLSSAGGKFSLCLGLLDELSEIETHKAMLIRSAVKDLNSEAGHCLLKRDIEPRGIIRAQRKEAGWKKTERKIGRRIFPRVLSL